MSEKKIKLPEDFIARLPLIFGDATARAILTTFCERPTSFRVNTIKMKRLDVLHVLQAQGFKVLPVGWYPDAFILQNKSKRDLMATELYTSGKIYLQSLASMVPPLVLAPEPGETVLDLTAAPGSKTSQIAARMERMGEFVANDNNKIRFFKLKHNIDLLGVSDEKKDWKFKLTMFHGVALAKKYKNYFDKILLDAPCSAEARFITGDTSTYGYWSERKVKEMAYKQRALLLSVWGALKPGGTLVYSTCTFAPEENELQIERLLARYKDAVVEPANLDGLKAIPGLTKWKDRALPEALKKTIRLVPTKDTEGFYIAKISKK